MPFTLGHKNCPLLSHWNINCLSHWDIMKVTILIVTIYEKFMQKNLPNTNSSKFLLITEIIVPTASKSSTSNNTLTYPLLKKKKVWKTPKDSGKIISIYTVQFLDAKNFSYKNYMILMMESRLPWGGWNLTHVNSCRLVMFKKKKKTKRMNHRSIVVMRSCRAADLCHVQPVSFWERIKGAASKGGSIHPTTKATFVCM
jgi:hypothetical protein